MLSVSQSSASDADETLFSGTDCFDWRYDFRVVDSCQCIGFVQPLKERHLPRARVRLLSLSRLVYRCGSNILRACADLMQRVTRRGHDPEAHCCLRFDGSDVAVFLQDYDRESSDINKSD